MAAGGVMLGIVFAIIIVGAISVISALVAMAKANNDLP
jgi:hypothetical protein